MIERKKVKCPIGTRPYTEMCLDHRSLYCSTCKKGVCAELDPDFIARLQSIIEQQEVSIKAYKRLAKRWMKMAKWLADIDSRIGCYACVARFNNCGLDMTRSSIKGCKVARIKAAKKAVEGEEG
jgi:hypothetical protein